MITELEAKIKEKLEAIEDLAFVYDYYEDKPEWYPYASFEFTNFQWKKENNCENSRDWVFGLLVFQELSKKSRQEAKNIINWITEKIIESFDKDEFLWWLVDKTEVVAGEVGNGKDNNKGDWLYIDITLVFTSTLRIK